MSNTENQVNKLSENLIFPNIFRSFRMAIHPTKMLIALMAVILIWLTGWVMDFSKTVTTSSGSYKNELVCYIANPQLAGQYIEHNSEQEHIGVFDTLWNFSSETFHRTLISLFNFRFADTAEQIRRGLKAPFWAFRYHTIYSIIFFATALGIFSITGGAICRISSLQFARGEKPGITEALRFSISKFWNLFTAPLTPLVIIVFLGLPVFILGLICKIPVAGEIVTALGAPMAVIAGALITVVVIGAIAGTGLMFPAIAYENSDCFDAISRSFSYVYARPWRTAFYSILAGIYGAFCYIFVRFFAFSMLWMTRKFILSGYCLLGASPDNNKLDIIWPQPAFESLTKGCMAGGPEGWAMTISAFLVCVLLLVVLGLVTAFLVSFYFSANTIIYSLLRKLVDNTRLSDVAIGRTDQFFTDNILSDNSDSKADNSSQK